MSEASLTLDGTSYGGWKSVTVRRSIETVAGTFSLGLSERWPGQQARRGILPGQACTVAMDGEVVITGFVDDVMPSYTSTSHDLAVTGRDATCDLVDCSAIHKPGEWTDQKLEAIAAALTKPFGIRVTAETDTGAPFRKFRIEEGETVFEAIERACRMRAVLPASDGKGGLRLIRAGGGRAAVSLRRGENILEANGRLSHRDRFSQYIVKGQQPSYADQIPPEQLAQVRGEASDPGARRHRPLMIIAEQSVDNAVARDRAKWEANVRAARARRIGVTVQGWRERPGGALWEPNRLVRLTDDWMDVDQDMLIVDVTGTKDDQGERSVLGLMPPGAFELRAEPEPEEYAGWMQ